MFQLCIKVVRIYIYIHILFESVHIIFMVFKTLYTEKNKGAKNLKFSCDKKCEDMHYP